MPNLPDADLSVADFLKCWTSQTPDLSDAEHLRCKISQIALRYAQDNLEVKKVSAPSKNPGKCPIICFAREKKK